MKVTEEQFEWMVEQMTGDLIRLLIEREDYEFTQAFETVYNSDTYRVLQDPKSTFYYQSAGYVFDFLVKEIKTGKMG